MSELLMPYYRVFIGGVEFNEFQYSMVSEITYEDTSTGSDVLTIRLNDPDFIFLNDNFFIEDVQIKFIGGYSHNNRVMFEGWISIIDVDFPDTGSPRLTINCMDNSHVMNRVKKKRKWENTTRARIVAEIFREYGLKSVIEDSGKVEESISQNNETDINFILKLAREEIDTYLLYIEGTTGHYVKKKLVETPQYYFDYRDGKMNVINFSPRINKEVKQVESRSSDINILDKETDKGQANNNTDRDVSGSGTNSTDSTNNRPSWIYNNGKWTQSY